MYTQCPDCLSVFFVHAPALARAHAYLTCGHCGIEFDALATLADELPPAPFRELPLHEPAFTPPTVELAVYRPQADPPAVSDDTAVGHDAPAAGEFAQLVFAPRFARAAVPRDAQPAHRHIHGAGHHGWPWAIACVVLTLLLGAQVAWATRDTLISEPLTGAWLRASCATLHCTLPLVAAPRQLQLLDSNVQNHPSVAQALMISASVRNGARFAQPYPVLTLSLSDAQGQRLAMRRLRPPEYLDDSAVLGRGLAPGATTVLLLEVVDPGDQAVAFEFDFE